MGSSKSAQKAAKLFLERCQLNARICQLSQRAVFICQAVVFRGDLSAVVLGNLAGYRTTDLRGNILQLQRPVDVMSGNYKSSSAGRG